ncbi:MAG: hypothetical protein AAGC46_06215 [Solirubrobacteraceae bacterium]
MALIFLLSALLLGTALVRRIPFPLYRFEAVALAVGLGLFGWTWLTFVLELLFPYDLALSIVVTLCVAAFVGLWRGGKPEWRPLEGGRRSWIVWGIATALTGVMIVTLFWSHNLPQDSQGIWSYAATWGDYGLHASIISHIDAATRLPNDLSVASGEKMTYPFLIDLLSAMYVHGGWSLHSSLFWPGALLALSICQLLISVGLRLFGRISVGVGGLGMALFIGSAAGTWTAWHEWRKSGQGFFDFLGKLPSDYTQLAGPNAHVTNLLTDAMLPQRSFLFGLAVGLAVIVFLHAARERGETKLLWPAALLVGLLPMAHPHTFLVCCALFAGVIAEAGWKKKGLPISTLVPFVAAIVLALPQIIWQQVANHNGSGGHFKWFWMWESGQTVPGYWWANFGLIGIAFLAIPVVFRKHRQVLWFLPLLLVLAFTQVYSLQPTEYDDLKLIYWVYIVGGFFIAYAVSEAIRRLPVSAVLFAVLGVFVFTPGALSIVHDYQAKYQFASTDDIALADWVGKNTSPDAIFASAEIPNNPVATLAGRRLVMGYSGWLYNFSIDYTARANAVRAALSGNFQDPGLLGYKANYLIVRAAEQNSYYPANQEGLNQHPVAWSNASWTVYALQ